MKHLLHATIGTLFLGLTLGAMCLVMIWGILSMIHANNIIILSGESLAAIGLLIMSVPVFRLILKNERGRDLESVFEEPVVRIERPAAGPKPTAFV